MMYLSYAGLGVADDHLLAVGAYLEDVDSGGEGGEVEGAVLWGQHSFVST